MGGRQALPKRRSGENVQIVPRSVSAIEDASRTTLAECTDDGAGYLGSGAEVDGIGKDGSSSGTHDREGTTTKRLEDQSGGSEAVSATQRADMTTLADRSLADSAPGSFKIAIATHRNLAATVDNARTVASLVDKSDSGSTSTANSNNHNNEGIGIGQFDGELRRISSLTEAFTKLYAESRLQEAAATLQEVLRIMQGRRARKINVKASNGNSDDGNNTLTTKRHFTQGGKDVPIRESHDSPGAAKDKEVLVEDRQMDTRGSGDRDGGRSGLESDSTADGVEPPLKSGVEEVEVEEETLAIARVMNDLGCTLQQVSDMRRQSESAVISLELRKCFFCWVFCNFCRENDCTSTNAALAIHSTYSRAKLWTQLQLSVQHGYSNNRRNSTKTSRSSWNEGRPKHRRAIRCTSLDFAISGTLIPSTRASTCESACSIVLSLMPPRFFFAGLGITTSGR